MAGVIWLASSDLGAMSHQSRILGPILAALGFSPETTIKIIVFIRKNAHMGEYALFAVLAWRGWHARPLLWRRTAWRWWPDALAPLGFAVAWASLDEFHQSFVPSRTASVGDVCWDTAGALIGLAVLWLWHRGGKLQAPSVKPQESPETEKDGRDEARAAA